MESQNNFNVSRLAVRPLLIVLCLFLVVFCASSALTPAKKSWLLDIKGAIGPATQDYIERSIKLAEKSKVSLIILRIDTPGGLDSAMRGINQAILSSTIPVISYVAPTGARAASAGTYILYASAIAAMAPGTHLGAASPVMMGEIPDPGKEKESDKKANSKQDNSSTQDNASTLHKKAMEDAVAYIRGLATLHGRNADWAEKAVRQAASLSWEQAYQLKVIDVIADNEADLLQKINGKQVKLNTSVQTLDTDAMEIQNHPPDWRYQFLAMITDPNIAYILLLLGIYGLFFEFSNPGLILPGIVGGIALVIALYAFQMLPINYAGFALLLLGMLFIILEAYVSSFGALGIGGVIAFTLGSIFLLDTESSGYGISWTIIFLMAAITAAFLFIIASLAIASFRKKVVTGVENLVGKTGYVMETQGTLVVKIEGEIWQAFSPSPLIVGQKVVVTSVSGLQLTVKPRL